MLHCRGAFAARSVTSLQDDYLWGWDPTPGIVSVWAERDGQATIWRRVGEPAGLVCEHERFRPWILTDIAPATGSARGLSCRELDGPGALRFLVSANDSRTLTSAVLQ